MTGSDTAVPDGSGRHRSGLRTTVLVVAVTVAAGAAVAATVGVRLPDETGRAKASVLPPATATVVRQTLIDSKRVPGELGFGPADTALARAAGTLTAIAPAGATVTRGEALYTLNNEKVVLLYGALPAYRTLEIGMTGPDVEQFERNLLKLGYTGFTADAEYTASTAQVVQRWQTDLGLPKTGTVEPGRISYAAGRIRVDAHRAKIGDLLQIGGPVLNTTDTRRLVTVTLKIADRRLAKKNSKVDVILPDHSTAPGRIVSSEIVITSGDGEQQEGPETTIEVTIAANRPAALKAFDRASVDVSFATERRENVLTVPVSALLVLPASGYGVEVVDGTSTRMMAVQTGLFAGGRVEVTGQGLTEGLTVGTPL